MRRALLVALALAALLALGWLAQGVGGGEVLLPRDPERGSNRAELEREESARVALEADIELEPAAVGERSDFEALALRAGSLEPGAGARLWCWSEPGRRSARRTSSPGRRRSGSA